MSAAKKTVFISSTYEDLADHRRAVWDVLGSFDVSLRGMEEFGARPEEPLVTCLAEVEQSNVYVGILAFRLGSIDEKSAKSFTQIEYEHASELGKDILIYLADEQEARFRLSDIEHDVQRREKLSAFKRTLMDNHTVNWFKDPADLAERLRRDFRRYFVEKPQQKTPIDKEFQAGQVLLDRFFLLPRSVSGSEIRVRVKRRGSPFAASRAVCSPFNLRYGATIGIPIDVIKPSMGDVTKFRDLYGAGGRAEELLGLLESDKPVDLYATVRFTATDVERTRAEFIGYGYHRPEEPDDYYWNYVPADGKAVLLYSKPTPDKERL